jgi:hypothetical protein
LTIKPKKKFKKFMSLLRHKKDSKESKDNGLFDRAINMAKVVKSRSNADYEILKQEQSKEIKELLEKFYKERGLQRNGKKIAWETAKGAIFGAAGGAFGAWAFEHVAHFAADKGWISKDLVDHSGTHGQGATAGAEHGGTALNGADASHTVDAGKDVVTHVASSEDLQHMDGSVWNTVKEYMVNHGVAHPSNADINSGMKAIALANGVEIDAHHALDPNHAGHFADAVKKFLDTKMQQGTELHGFDSLKEIIEKAGGHVLGAQEIITHIPGGAEAVTKATTKEAAKEAVRKLAEQDHTLRNIITLLGIGGAATYLARRNNKNSEQRSKEMSLNIGKVEKSAPTYDLIGNEEELKTASLERRLEVLGQVKERALKLIANAGALLPNVSEFRKAMEPFDDQVLAEQQFNLLVVGASEEDKKKMGEAWDKTIEEIQQSAKPFEDKANELEVEAATAAELSGEDESDGLDVDEEEESKTHETEEGKEEVKEGWIAKHAEGQEKAKAAQTKAEKALKDGNTDLAQEHYLEMVAAIAGLAVFARGFKGSEQKFANKQIETIQKKADVLSKNIEAAKKEKEEAVEKAKTPAAETGSKVEAEKLGLEDWQIKLYHQMLELKLMTPLPEGNKFEKGTGNLNRLNKFALFTKEDGGLFKSITAGGAKGWKIKFFEALTDLSENDPTKINQFYLDLLKKGYELGKESQIEHILDEMSGISTEIANAVSDARFSFVKPVKKPGKKKK